MSSPPYTFLADLITFLLFLVGHQKGGQKLLDPEVLQTDIYSGAIEVQSQMLILP